MSYALLYCLSVMSSLTAYSVWCGGAECRIHSLLQECHCCATRGVKVTMFSFCLDYQHFELNMFGLAMISWVVQNVFNMEPLGY